jgi:hypothetical protein
MIAGARIFPGCVLGAFAYTAELHGGAVESHSAKIGDDFE